jgi:hypothetical protein
MEVAPALQKGGVAWYTNQRLWLGRHSLAPEIEIHFFTVFPKLERVARTNPIRRIWESEAYS